MSYLDSRVGRLNVLVHLVGTKVMTIAPPSQSHRLYPSERFDSGALLSSVNLWDPDLEQYPEYSKLKSIEITVHAGDVLLVPMSWWHAVKSHDSTVSVSVRHLTWFENILNSADRSKERLHNVGLYGDFKDRVCHAPGIYAKSLGPPVILGEADYMFDPVEQARAHRHHIEQGHDDDSDE